jgi:hypothetical protein
MFLFDGHSRQKISRVKIIRKNADMGASGARLRRQQEEWAMLDPQQVEEIMSIIAAMNRELVIERLKTFRGGIPVDFTNQFLADQPTDRLRHIYAALCLQSRALPDDQVPTAA